MKETRKNTSNTYSLKFLTLAIAFTIFTIIVLALVIIFNRKEVSNFLFPAVLTIISIIITFFALEGTHRTLVTRSEPTFFSFIRNSKLFIFLSKAAQIVSILIILLIILFIIALSSLAFGYINHLTSLIVIGSLTFLTTIFLSFTMFNLLQYKAETIQNSPSRNTATIDTNIEDFLILRKEIVYEYFPAGKTMRQTKRLEVQALKDRVNHFIDKYRWTGSGQCNLKVLTPGFIIARQEGEGVSPWTFFEVRFPHKLRKNEIADFTVEWELVDEKGTGVTFLSATVDTDTKFLSLEVILPEAPKRAYAYEFANYIDAVPIETNELIWRQATKSLCYEVPFPKKYHRYLIRWYNED